MTEIEAPHSDATSVWAAPTNDEGGAGAPTEIIPAWLAPDSFVDQGATGPAPAAGAGSGPGGRDFWPGAPEYAPERAPAPDQPRRAVAVVLVVALIAGIVGAFVGATIAHHTKSSVARDAAEGFGSRGGFASPFAPSGRGLTPNRPAPPGGAGTTPSSPGSGNSAIAPNTPTSPAASAIAASVEPAVVDITTELGYQNASAAGSGMVLSASGEILTNNHVVDGATKISVQLDGKGTTYAARVVGTDPSDDVALLELQGASNLPTITPGDSSKLTIGEPVVALGNAFGRGGPPAITSGNVTALNQRITATDRGTASSQNLTGLIQTDALLRPGDSGGPMVNAAGAVIGMNTAASGGGRFRSAPNASFAIPINKALSIVDDIRAGRASTTIHIGPPAFLGVQTQGVGVGVGSTTPTSPGAEIIAVVPNTPAAGAGLKAGDVIVSFDGKNVDSPATLTVIIGSHHPGDSVDVAWNDQAGRPHTAKVKLATGPAA